MILLNFNNLIAPVEHQDEADGADDLVLRLPNNGRNQTLLLEAAAQKEIRDFYR